MAPPLHVSFSAGSAGPWRIEQLRAVTGETLPAAERLSMHDAARPLPTGMAVWSLSGVVSNTRYTTRGEAAALAAVQQGLGRPGADCAALIPIRKTDAWWSMAQDERRAIFEDESRHVGIGLAALPAVARRLHHSRDLGGPFDFLTWFEFAREDSGLFDDMLRALRATREWCYVDREVEIRLNRVTDASTGVHV